MQTQWQPLLVLIDGNRDTRQTGKVHGHCKHVIQIHLDWISVCHFAQSEGRRGGRWCQDRVNAIGKHFIKVLLNQSTNPARTVVIGVIKTCRQHICAHHHAALHFGSKPFGAGLFIHLGDAIALCELRTVPKAHTVIAGKVRRGLGRSDHVVCWQRVFSVRQRNVDNLGTRIFKHRSAVFPELLNRRWHTIHAIFFGDTNRLAANITSQRRLKIWHRQVSTCAVERIVARHRTQHDRRVAHVFGHRTRLIER